MNKFYTKKYFEKRDLLIPHLAQTIENLTIENKLKNVLDVGCGTGKLVKYLNSKGANAYGCDISKQAIAFAKKTNGLNKIKQASCTSLPYQAGTFDLITAISVIEHINKKGASLFLREAKRVLKPHGFIFIVTPNFATPIRLIQGKKWFGYNDPTHINFYTPASLKKSLFKYNFKNTKTQFSIGWRKSLNWEFPSFTSKLPKTVKKILAHLLFSSTLSILRNSFWMLAQKDG